MAKSELLIFYDTVFYDTEEYCTRESRMAPPIFELTIEFYVQI